MLIADIVIAIARLNSTRSEKAKRSNGERMAHVSAEPTHVLRRIGLFALMCGSYYVLTEFMKWAWSN